MYDYSKIHDIIELQYAKRKGGSSNTDMWFWEETLKLGSGNIKPSNYLQNVGNNIFNKNNIEIPNMDDEPIYIYK
jgi:hypothetical protein